MGAGPHSTACCTGGFQKVTVTHGKLFNGVYPYDLPRKSNYELFPFQFLSETPEEAEIRGDTGRRAGHPLLRAPRGAFL